MSTFNLICSPKTFSRAQNDESFRCNIVEEARHHLLGTYDPDPADQFIIGQENAMEGNEAVPGKDENHNTTENEDLQTLLDETQNLLEDLHSSSDDVSSNEAAGSSKKIKNVWLDAPTKYLISLVKEMEKDLGKNMKLSNKTKMWRLISTKMKSKGYSFTPQQIKQKYHSLVRQYKIVTLNNSKTGRSRMKCNYQSDLDSILVKKKGVFPEYTLDSAEVEGKDDVENVGVAGVSSEHLDSDVEHVKKRKKSTIGKMCEALEEKRNFHNSVLEFLKQTEENSQRRFEEAQKKKEEIAERKCKLLEKLIEKMK